MQISNYHHGHHHILVVCYPAQGHITPALRLAKCLADDSGARITFSTTVHAYRRMFPPSAGHSPDHDPFFSHIPYSNGYDDGFDPKKDGRDLFMALAKQRGSQTLADIVDDLAACGRPVTCVIFSFFISWAAEIARRRRIPCFLFWIQPATAFAAYWHYFRDNRSVNAVSGDQVCLPGMPPMRQRDLPSFIFSNSPESELILSTIREMFEVLDVEKEMNGSKATVIVNTADELESPAIASVSDEVELIGIGPLNDVPVEGSLFKEDECCYTEWLDGQEDKSVVYVSFGSMAVLKREQVEEIQKGLNDSGRAYLWVLRKDSRWEGAEIKTDEKGMVVEWCAQEKVLRHRAVGCFVTHCGWNSTAEAVVNGIPTVAVPQWSDQGTNAWLMEREWGTGVRAEMIEAGELRRCLDVVMGEGGEGEELRRRTAIWKEKARMATATGGSSHINLTSFVGRIVGNTTG